MAYTDGGTVFLLSVTGQISSGHFPGAGDLYCKYNFVAGNDWSVTGGQEEGLSQITRPSLDARQTLVWNFPLDITFRSTCPFGWPQLVISVYELDGFGNEVVKGYGAVHVHLEAGSFEAKVPMFVPQSSSLLQRFMAYFLGKQPEFVDPRVVANGDGRDVTRVSSNGWIAVRFHTMSKDLKKLGYETKSRGKIEPIRNQGPSQGMGLVQPQDTKVDNKPRKAKHPQDEDPEAIETFKSDEDS